MGNTTKHEKKNKKELQKGLKKKTPRSSSPARGKLLEKQGDKRADNIAERGDYRALERRHDGAARARGEVVAKHAAESEARQSADTPHAEADMRAALAALAAEEGRRWAEVARVARLSDEMDRHLPSPPPPPPAAALSVAAAHPTILYPIRRFSLVFYLGLLQAFGL